jgi:hypothetical protein
MFAAKTTARHLAFVVALMSATGCGSMSPGVYQKVGTVAAHTVNAPSIHLINGASKTVVTTEAATVNLEVSFGAAFHLKALDNIVIDPNAPAVLPTTGNVPAELDHVDFLVSYGNGAATLKYTVNRAQFLTGKAVLQMNNIPAGLLHVEAVAMRADGSRLISATGDGNVAVGQLTVVHLTCNIPPAPTPGPSATPVALGHVRLEMDCWTNGQCNPTPTPTPVVTPPMPSPSVFVPYPVNTVNFHSLGDPHEEGANQFRFENQLVGTFQSLQTLTHDLSVIKHQDHDPTGRWPGTTLNQAIGIRSGSDKFVYFVYGHRARLNGKTLNLGLGDTVTADGGATITRIASDKTVTTFRIVTPQGDQISISDFGAYLNLSGSLGTTRVVGEVNGEFGTYNNGSSQAAMRLRDGTLADSLPAYLNNWFATTDEDFISGADEQPVIPAKVDDKPLDAAAKTT